VNQRKEAVLRRNLDDSLIRENNEMRCLRNKQDYGILRADNRVSGKMLLLAAVTEWPMPCQLHYSRHVCSRSSTNTRQ
jgi:hypothetical protein